MSNIVAMIMARNEEWILEACIRQARKWCDQIVVLDHASTDNTGAIAKELADLVVYESNPEWREMEYRQAMFDAAATLRPSHVAFIDADEMVTNNATELYRDAVLELQPGQVGVAPMIPVWGSLDTHRDDGSVWSTSWISIAVGFKPNLTWQPRADGYQHHAREPRGAPVRLTIGKKYQNGVFHLQFAYKRRLRAKHAWYKMMEVLRYGDKPREIIDRQYSQALDESGIRLSKIPDEWWDPEVKRLIGTRHEPWHEGECRRMVKEEGRDFFKGLDLFGVV